MKTAQDDNQYQSNEGGSSLTLSLNSHSYLTSHLVTRSNLEIQIKTEFSKRNEQQLNFSALTTGSMVYKEHH